MQPIKLHGGASQPGDYATPYNNGLEAFARGDFADAERWFRRALRVEPNSADCLYNLGNAQMAAGLIDAAVESYTKSLGLKPNQPDVLVNLGNAYALSKKDPASAILNFEAALRIAEDPQARFNLAVVLDNEGRLEEAVDNYRKALKGGIGHAEKFLRNAMVRLASRVAQSGSKEGADKKE
ncbi:hypothetical protein DFJ74DRAFT_603544 [Hyaloraphidium curvatum]|nr:hypothetical protein DFJ74DRAFT_603544 [Hyaloraphidium curvatum]